MVDHKNQLVIGSALLALALVLTASYSRSSNPQSNNSSNYGWPWMKPKRMAVMMRPLHLIMQYKQLMETFT